MANQQQKRKKPAARKKKMERDEGLKPYEDEIIIVVTLVACILLVLSNLNMCGIFGVAVSHLFFGLFGFMNYIMPFGIFIGMAFYLSNKGSKKANRKLASVIALMVILMALLQLSYASYENGTNVSEYFAQSAETKMGGGMLGGFVSGILCRIFGQVGAIVILIGAGLLLCMFISEKLIFAPMGKRGYQKMQEMKESRRIQREEYERIANAERKEEPVKRRAKTFVIEKEPLKEEKKAEKKKSAKVEENMQVDVHGEIKAEKKTRKKRKDTSVDMKEITPTGIEHMSIIRTEIPADNCSMPVYEEELMQKFNPVHAEMKTDLGTFDSEPTNAQHEKMDMVLSINKRTGVDNSAPIETECEETGIDNYDPIETEIAEDPAELLKMQEMPLSKPKKAKKAENTGGMPEEQEHSDENAKKRGYSSTGVASSSTLHRAERNKTDKLNEDATAELSTLKTDTVVEIPYQHPTLDLLQKPSGKSVGISDEELKKTAIKLHDTLESFGVNVNITNVSCGPAVTRYELHPEQGVKVSKITGLADDIKLNLAAADIRIEAPIPGKAAVGIEVPNKENSAVMLRELMESQEFSKHTSNIAFAVGKDIAGKTVVSDIAKMPHLLIAGATGSGKSVCINTLIMSILYKADPNDVKLIMVDPKVVELSVYNGIPHLLIPVVTDPKKASAALNWAVVEMTERYKKFADLGVRDLKGYNEKVAQVEDMGEEQYKKLPQIVIIVDELADLMMVAPGEVEEAICRLAQLARAAGIHLVIATQRPSVNVITGVIKANIPSRIAFSVSSAVDSRTILDSAGAEKLLGKGDMLFYPAGFPKPIRVQGAFVSDQEVSAVVEFLTRDVAHTYDNSIVEQISSQTKGGASGSSPANDRDEYFAEAAKFIVEKEKASIGMLQRVFKIGFNRASRIMDQLYEAGVVGEEEGTKPRKVLMSMEQLEEFIESGGV